MRDPSEIFPEYFLIRVNEFNDYARTPLEEWMDYLKNGIINDDTKTPGLSEAKEKLQYLMMTDSERIAYERHIDTIRIQSDVLGNAKAEGLEEGRAEGWAEGRAEGLEKGRAEGIAEGELQKQREIARNLKKLGIDTAIIAQSTGLSVDEINNLSFS